MIYKHNEPLLICEAGLHGDGDPTYYLGMIEYIRSRWSGWPRLAFKMQHWHEQGKWVEVIREMHGRNPLKSVNSMAEMGRIREACRDAGIYLMTTPHDTASVSFVEYYVDMFKLGAHDATQNELVKVLHTSTEKLEKSIVVNMSKVKMESLPFSKDRVRFIEGVSAYPANMPYTGTTGGYSCHSVPLLIPKHVIDAAHKCRTIEVHVTKRKRTIRPLPGDMCVSLDLLDFMSLAEGVGEIWNNCN